MLVERVLSAYQVGGGTGQTLHDRLAKTELKPVIEVNGVSLQLDAIDVPEMCPEDSVGLSYITIRFQGAQNVGLELVPPSVWLQVVDG